MNSDLSAGVTYVATGDACYSEALRSARSVRQHHPDLPIALISERLECDPIFNQHLRIADPQFSMLDKVRNLKKTPFDRTLYLDSDTYVTSPIDELFLLLEKYDFVGTHEVARGIWYEGALAEVPNAFGDINGGMLLFRKTTAVREMLDQWWAAYLETASWLPNFGSSRWVLTNDQPSLRKLLWEAEGLRLYVVPSEYNALRNFGTYIWGRAKIVHGRGDIAACASQMNQQENIERVYLQRLGTWMPMDRMPFRVLLENWARLHVEICLKLFRSARRLLNPRKFRRIR